MRTQGHKRLLTISLLILTSALRLPAAEVQVTSTNDSGAGSLRNAIATAAAGDTITFSLPTNSIIALTSNELLITKNLTINGPGADQLTVQRSTAAGTPEFRVFHINGNLNVTLTGLTISNGKQSTSTQGAGGGIRNSGSIHNSGSTLTIANSTISGNETVSTGGGIFSDQTLTIINSTVSGNRSNGGGGIFSNGGTVNVLGCTISGNTASSDFGGISSGGGISSSRMLTVTNSTITGNTTGSGSGGGVRNDGGTFKSRNTIIASNTTARNGPDIFGPMTSDGFNLIGNNTDATINSKSTDQIGTATSPIDPKLDALGNNGGPTRTHALLSGSPALDKGQSSGEIVDQRGSARPVDDPGPGFANAAGGDGADIGAYEVQADILPGCSSVDRVVRNTDDSGAGSLRAVLASVCAGSTITFGDNVRGTITLVSEQLLVNKSLTINGPGANLLTVRRSSAPGTPTFRVLTVTGSVQASISGLTLSNGNHSAGGGLYSGANMLLLDRVAVSGNSSHMGGGIFNEGNVTLTHCSVTGNTADSGAGGIYHRFNLLTVTDSTISGNRCNGASSGLPGQGLGGGIYSGAPTVLKNNTISHNSATSGGGGVANANTSVRSRNTIIALNTAPAGPDVQGSLASENFNLIGNNVGASISAAQFSDQIGTSGAPIDPLLGPLADDGGPTLTRALLSGSRAIDKGHASGATTDQRGFSRPADQSTIVNASGGDGADIGAFEVTLPPTPTPTPQPNRFANISTRLRVEIGENVLIGGFIVTGSTQKRIIIRALGPSLPVEDRLANPLLELYNGSGELIAVNDNWQEAPNAQEIVESTIPPPNELESALIGEVGVGAYTAVVRDVADGEGVGLVEVYDLGSNQDSKLANISTRGRVLTGDNVMIGGLIVTGSSAQRVIVRAIGPSLPVEGRLEDPALELFDSQGNPIAANNDWRESQQGEVEATTIPPADDREAAIVTSLSPAAYTAVVRGVNDTSGVALVEVYALQ